MTSSLHLLKEWRKAHSLSSFGSWLQSAILLETFSLRAISLLWHSPTVTLYPLTLPSFAFMKIVMTWKLCTYFFTCWILSHLLNRQSTSQGRDLRCLHGAPSAWHVVHAQQIFLREWTKGFKYTELNIAFFIHSKAPVKIIIKASIIHITFSK